MGALSSLPRAWPGLIVGLAALCKPAAAQTTEPRYRFEMVRAEGAASCPSAAAVEREVTTRLGRNPFSGTGERGIEVVLERVDAVWRARLYLRLDPSEPDQVRSLESEADDCSELSKAVTLAVSLAIAPELSAEPVPPPPPPQPTCPPPEPPAPSAPPALPAPKSPSLHGAASLRALYAPQLLPGPSLGAAIAISLRGDLLGATFGGVFFPENELQRADAHVGFGLSAGFVAGCLWARISDPQLWSCLGARAGVLHAVVHAPRPAAPGDRFWAAATSELGVRQHLYRRLFVEAGAVGTFPLLQYRFRVDEGATPIYEQGAALVEAFFGVGLELD